MGDWEWSLEKRVWLPTAITTPITGTWKGQCLAQANVEVILFLEKNKPLGVPFVATDTKEEEAK
jgi:hypothetical protein